MIPKTVEQTAVYAVRKAFEAAGGFSLSLSVKNTDFFKGLSAIPAYQYTINR